MMIEVLQNTSLHKITVGTIVGMPHFLCGRLSVFLQVVVVVAIILCGGRLAVSKTLINLHLSCDLFLKTFYLFYKNNMQNCFDC